MQKDEVLKINENRLSHKQFDLFKCYLERLLIVPEYPVYLLIEPTNNCNFKCVMCPRKNMIRPLGQMELQLFQKIIDEVEGKVEFIWLHFFGEPLMNKKIIDFINYAGGKGITLGMSTNGFFLDNNIINELLNSKLDLLLISIDSLSQDTFQKIRLGGDLSIILKNVDILLKCHKQKNSPLNIVLSMINLPFNQKELNHFLSNWKKSSGINVVIKPFDNFAGQEEDIVKLSTSVKNYNEELQCVEPWRGLAIGWDGQIVPCCYDFDYKYPLGNVHDSSIFDIWNSNKMMLLREAHAKKRKRNIGLCNNCSTHNIDFSNGISLFSSFNPSIQETIGYFNKGLYAPEISPNSQIIWTKKEFSLLIQDRFNDVKIIFHNFNPNYKSIQMNISLFDRIIGTYEISRKTEIFLKTPQSFKGRLLRYEFLLNHDWIPKECNINDDSRSLGVIIDRIIN